MRASNPRAAASDLDSKMQAIEKALDDFAKAITTITQQIQNGSNGTGANTTFGGALNQAQAAQSAIQTSGAPVGLPSVPGAPSSMNSGASSLPATGPAPSGMPMGISGLSNAPNVPFGGMGSGSAGSYAFAGSNYFLTGHDAQHIFNQFAAPINAYTQTQVNQTLNGGRDYMGEANQAKGIAGALGFGAGLIGSGGNPIVASAVAGITSTAVGWIADPWAAANQAKENVQQFNTPLNNSVLGYQAGLGMTNREAGHMTELTGQLNANRWDKQFSGNLHLADDTLGKTLAGVNSALYAGGIDPYANANDGHAYGTEWRETARLGMLELQASLHGGSLTVGNGLTGAIGVGGKYWHGGEGLVLMAKAAAQYANRGPESVGEMYTRRLGEQYGLQAPEVEKQVAPIFGSLPETGGNIADIVSRFGPQSTSAYLRLQNDAGDAAVDPMALSRTSASMRAGQRKASIGALQARGSGAAELGGLQDELGAIDSLPGGKDSLAHAQTAYKMRGAMRTQFHQEDIEAYDLEATHLQGQRERSNLLPFNPSNRFGIELRSIVLDDKQIGRLTSRMNSLRKSGNLTEDDELDLTGRIEGLQTDRARGISVLADGMSDRLPALYAGRVSGFTRHDSYDLAAMRLGQIGSPIRHYGAQNGQQLQMQNDWISAQGASGPGVGRPMAPTSGVNMGGQSDRVAAALERLASVIERSSGGGRGAMPNTMSQTAGTVARSLDQKSLGQDSIYNTAN